MSSEIRQLTQEGVDIYPNTVASAVVTSGGATVEDAIAGRENTTNKVSSFQSTPDNDHYPSEKLVKDSLDGKQATLVSGTNIKTINNQSILGSGDLTIQGGGGMKDYAENDPENAAYIENRPGGYDYTLYDQDIEYSGVTLERQSADDDYLVEDIIPETSTLRALAVRGVTIPCTYVPSDGTMQGQTVNGTIFYDAEGEGLTLTTATGDDSTEASDITIDPADIPGGILVEDVYHYPIKFPSKYIPSDDAKEDKANKVSDISANRESTEKYPNAKAVYDAYFKRGVVSQTQTWTMAADGGYDYVMSDPVYGNIPRYFIDLWKSRGGNTAGFNETTGYFVYAGLDNISYDEASRIYANAVQVPCDGAYYLVQVRAALPFLTIKGGSGPAVTYFLFNRSSIETLHYTQLNRDGDCSISGNGSFGNATRLKTIVGVILAPSSVYASFFTGCYTLETLQLKGLAVSITFASSSRLSVASILYMINNEAATSAITITLHATAYARAIADADIQAALTNHPNVSLASA